MLLCTLQVMQIDSAKAQSKTTHKDNSTRFDETTLVVLSNIAIPEISQDSALKPTSAPPADSTAVSLKCSLDQLVADQNGSRKPVLAGKSAGVNTAPAYLHSNRVTPVATVAQTRFMARPERDQKPASSPKSQVRSESGPAKSAPSDVGSNLEIVSVSWAAAVGTQTKSATACSGPAFRADSCPSVAWTPCLASRHMHALNSVPVHNAADDDIAIGSMSEISQSPSSQAQLTSLRRNAGGTVHPADLADMNNLSPLPQKQTPAPGYSGGMSGSYLAELHDLLQGDSSWVFGNETLLDLAPEESSEAQPGYLQELNSLLPNTPAAAAPARKVSSPRYRPVMRQEQQSSDVPYNLLPDPRVPGPTYGLMPDMPCEALGTEGIERFFKPMNRIQLSGVSTAPPEKDRSPEAASEDNLQRPDNVACQFMETASPACYFTPTQYGVRRPFRNNHQLWHNPLYFEDPNLERCGQSHGCLTTAGSIVHFASAIALTPYMTAVTHPNACVKALPDCPTCHSFGPEAYLPPWSWKGAAVQAMAITGIFYIVP